ncbi:MAG: glycine cleavage system protein GcvH [Candidatus Marinimicrobia bacterium]|nr:glycine cleavage system protein GcvH [Candidatus Neomarinimicrobiota bacterium]
MNIPQDLQYTTDHEWTRNEDGIITIGISDFAQGELGDIIFVELPEIGQEFDKGDPFGTIEAVKTVADLFAPVTGKIVEVNESLEDAPESVNSDCYGAGWIIKMKYSDPNELDDLISAADYEKSLD